MAATCNKNGQKQNGKNKGELQSKWRQVGKTLKTLLDKAKTGLLRPNVWQIMVMMIHSYVILLLLCTADDRCVLNLFITSTNCNCLQPSGSCGYDQI